jgi:hypothetical protein
MCKVSMETSCRNMIQAQTASLLAQCQLLRSVNTLTLVYLLSTGRYSTRRYLISLRARPAGPAVETYWVVVRSPPSRARHRHATLIVAQKFSFWEASQNANQKRTSCGTGLDLHIATCYHVTARIDKHKHDGPSEASARFGTYRFVSQTDNHPASASVRKRNEAVFQHSLQLILTSSVYYHSHNRPHPLLPPPKDHFLPSP